MRTMTSAGTQTITHPVEEISPDCTHTRSGQFADVTDTAPFAMVTDSV